MKDIVQFEMRFFFVSISKIFLAFPAKITLGSHDGWGDGVSVGMACACACVCVCVGGGGGGI